MNHSFLLLLALGSIPCASFAQSNLTGGQNPAPESVVSAPDQDLASDKSECTTYSRGSTFGKYDVVYNSDTEKVEGFAFSNHGPNSVVTKATRGIGMGPQRDYSFDAPQRARQDLKMTIVDVPTEFLSQNMNSYFYFFPRKVLPAIQWPTDGTSVFKVTLPTNEEVQFSTVTNEVVGGVLKETSPIDLGPDRFKRKFAGIEYTGSGVYVRVDKRGNDPRLGTTAIVSQGKKTCKVPSAKLFDQREDSAVLFLFPTDQGFNEFLKKTCKMSFM
jgi:hypothetical protein